MKVALIGGKSKKEHWEKTPAGKGDDDWEVWGLNAIRGGWRQGLKWARMFNLHRFSHLNRDCYGYILADTDWAKDHPKVPFYVVDSWHGLLPLEVLFPLEALRSLPRGGLYHAGSFDMMVALAIHEGASEIALHGVGLALDSHGEGGEPIAAHACLEYWCGVAEGRGIRVTAAADCDLFLQYHLVRSRSIYGFDDVKMVEDRT